MRMVELFTTGPARVLGMERKLAAGADGRPDDFFHRTRVDLQREGFGEQIAEFAV